MNGWRYQFSGPDCITLLPKPRKSPRPNRKARRREAAQRGKGHQPDLLMLDDQPKARTVESDGGVARWAAGLPEERR